MCLDLARTAGRTSAERLPFGIALSERNRVTFVEPSSAAAVAGLRKYDRILRVDQKYIAKPLGAYITPGTAKLSLTGERPPKWAQQQGEDEADLEIPRSTLESARLVRMDSPDDPAAAETEGRQRLDGAASRRLGVAKMTVWKERSSKRCASSAEESADSDGEGRLEENAIRRRASDALEKKRSKHSCESDTLTCDWTPGDTNNLVDAVETGAAIIWATAPQRTLPPSQSSTNALMAEAEAEAHAGDRCISTSFSKPEGASLLNGLL